MTAVLLRGLAPLINILTDAINIFIRRDKRILLCGAWMGERFADNSRFLFQYLFQNQEQYGIQKIVWVTRNINVYELLTKLGYEVYMMHSLKSIYYHLKAGTYIVCNLGFGVKGYYGDTMGHLAGHAIKINTWHGIPIKAGKSTSDNIKMNGLKSKIIYTLRTSQLFCSIFTPGHWDKAFYLSTGHKCTQRCSAFLNVDKKYFIEIGYPRDCITQEHLTEKESKILSYISTFEKTLLYVPTFREHGTVSHPLENLTFNQFIEDSGYLWIEKSHPAMDEYTNKEKNARHILYLESDFDINVILSKITLLITDYSSVCFDAIAYNKPVLYYASDYKYYLCKERGFLCDYKSFAGKNLSTTIEELKEQIIKYFEDNDYKKYTLQQTMALKKEMFDYLDCSEKNIVEKMCEQLNISH